MSRTNLFLATLVAWIALGVYLWDNYLCDCWGDKKEVTTSSKLSKQWIIRDSTLFSVTSLEHFRFEKSNPEYLLLSDKIIGKLNEIAAYLKQNPNRGITVTGYYEAAETNNSILSNLGLARANEVKAYLQGLGISANQISLSAKILDAKNTFFEKDTLQKGIEFGFNGLGNINNKLADIKARLLGKPLTVYFGTNEKQITLSDKQREDFADLIYYLDHVPDSYLETGGHTDNMGKKGVNQFLSLERANFVKDYLHQNGNISTERINTKGYGDVKPIAPNTSAANKALNRRVEVILN